MKAMMFASICECERQAIFQQEENSCCEVRPFQDRPHLVGLST